MKKKGPPSETGKRHKKEAFMEDPVPHSENVFKMK